MRVVISLVIAVNVLISSGCHSPYYRDQGAAFGGLAGAGIGAAIGEANDEPVAGAAIGTAIGALTGAVMGSGLDASAERQRRYEQQSWNQQQITQAASIQDVITMTSAGLSDDVIMTHVRNQGTTGPLTAHELIALKQQGVSDRVIQSLQQNVALAAYEEPIRVVQAVPSPQVVLAPSIIVPRGRRYPPLPPTYRHHGPHGGVRKSGINWGVAVGL